MFRTSCGRNTQFRFWEFCSCFSKAASAVFLIVVVGTLAWSQDQNSASSAPPTVSTAAFTTTAVLGLKGGKLPANFVIGNGCLQSWDVRAHVFLSGNHKITYPVVGVVDCTDSGSNGITVLAATTVFKADTRVESSRSGGYLIEPKQVVKAGDAVPSLLFIGKNFNSVVSIESVPGQKDKSDTSTAQPWLTIFDERLKPSERTAVLDAWRAANSYVSTALKMPGQFKVLP